MSTYDELWNSPRFIKKRIDEQYNYIFSIQEKVDSDIISYARYTELYDTAVVVLDRLINQQSKLFKQTHGS